MAEPGRYTVGRKPDALQAWPTLASEPALEPDLPIVDAPAL
jgi:hypothetical protein